MPELFPDYEPSVGAVVKALKSYWGQEISDPIKVAQVVLRLAVFDPEGHDIEVVHKG